MATTLMTIVLTGLLYLFVFILLVALVWCLTGLMHDDSTRDEETASAQRQQRFLQSSVLHVMNRAGR